MPKDTFYNLKEEKKIRITKAAISEISKYGIPGASVKRIVKEAKIATGSFYQYFDNINDLIEYIMSEAARQKSKYIRAEIDKVLDKNLDELLRAMYAGGIRFAVENNEMCKVGNALLQIKDTPMFYKIIKNISTDELFGWLIPIIQNAIQKGEINKNITFELFMMLIQNISLTILDYIASLDKSGNFEFNEKSMDMLSDLATNILLNGIKSTNKGDDRL